MTQKHAPSLFFSVIIHLLVGFIVYGTYQAVISITKSKKKEEVLCVSLQTYVSEVKKKERVKEKIVKKVPKKKIIHKSKPIHKKRVQVSKPQKMSHITKPVKRIQASVQESIKPSLSPIETEESPQETFVSQNVKKIVIPIVISPEKIYKDNHLEKIEALLQENLYYPRRARKRGIMGTVVVHFEIDENAGVSEIKVLSSKSEILSRAAIKTIENLSGKFPKPKEKLFLKIPITYRLNK